MLQHLPTKKSRILKGYAAFTDSDWETLREILSEDVVWHTMDGKETIRGRDGAYVAGSEDPTGVLEYLQQLRNTNDVEFMGMAIQGDAAITVDYTHTTDDEGDHACADKIAFDDSGCIKEVWHCAAATHALGHAGHPAGHTHP